MYYSENLLTRRVVVRIIKNSLIDMTYLFYFRATQHVLLYIIMKINFIK